MGHRNIAIIATSTTARPPLVDQLLRQSGTFRRARKGGRHRDGQQRHRTRARHHHPGQELRRDLGRHHINIVDTPGHADFGGEVERHVMVDGVLLLIDAQEGPMPQTRFVTKKALALGLKPIVVVNKVDKPGANPDYVINAAFDLFDKLGATDEQLDFPVVYASGINGWTSLEEGAGRAVGPDMSALFDTILKHVPAAEGRPGGSAAAADLGAGLFHLRRPHRRGGRISQGTIKPGMVVLAVMGARTATASRAASTRC